ncbi:MAG: hypothetical protein J7J96_03980 [Sulfurimonas sp.]|nr:hypothetical protein [Sulfurimonas sp.]
MRMEEKSIVSLIEYVKIDKFYISCYFKCPVKDKLVVSTVPFEPFDGSIEFTWQDILFHPIGSYNRYYHTPITIYSNDCHNTLVLKAFKKVSNYFIWNNQENRYIYN